MRDADLMAIYMKNKYIYSSFLFRTPISTLVCEVLGTTYKNISLIVGGSKNEPVRVVRCGR